MMGAARMEVIGRKRARRWGVLVRELVVQSECIYRSGKSGSSSSYVPITGARHFRAHPERIELSVGQVKLEFHRFVYEGRYALHILPGDDLHRLIGTNGIAVITGKGAMT